MINLYTFFLIVISLTIDLSINFSAKRERVDCSLVIKVRKKLKAFQSLLIPIITITISNITLLNFNFTFIQMSRFSKRKKKKGSIIVREKNIIT